MISVRALSFSLSICALSTFLHQFRVSGFGFRQTERERERERKKERERGKERDRET